MTIKEYKKDYPIIYQKVFDMFAKNARYYRSGKYIILKDGGNPDNNSMAPSFSNTNPARLFNLFLKHKIKLLEELKTIPLK